MSEKKSRKEEKYTHRCFCVHIPSLEGTQGQSWLPQDGPWMTWPGGRFFPLGTLLCFERQKSTMAESPSLSLSSCVTLGKSPKLSVPQRPHLQNRKDATNLRGLSGQRHVSLVAQMVKNLPATWETRVPSLGREDPWRRAWQPTSVFLPGEAHGQRSLEGNSPWSGKESDTTEAT